MKKFLLSLILVSLIFSSLFIFYGCKEEEKEVELLGAGATFPQPLYDKWFSVYYTKTNNNVKVNYQGIGSGGGIQQLTERVVDFGATDAFMSDEELKNASAEIIHIPTALGAVVVTYNLPDNPKLKFTGEMIADIFMGNITKWNDQKLKS